MTKDGVIDLCDSDDEAPPVATRPQKRTYIPDDDIIPLNSPPPHMKRWTNAERPIDVDADEEENLEMYTASQKKKRRELMLDEDPDAPFYRPKRKGRPLSIGADSQEEAEPAQAGAGPSTRSTARRSSTTAAAARPVPGDAGPSTRRAIRLHPLLGVGPDHIADEENPFGGAPPARRLSRERAALDRDAALAPEIPGAPRKRGAQPPAYAGYRALLERDGRQPGLDQANRPARVRFENPLPHPIGPPGPLRPRVRFQNPPDYEDPRHLPVDADLLHMRIVHERQGQIRGLAGLDQEQANHPEMNVALAEPGVRAAFLAPVEVSDPVTPPGQSTVKTKDPGIDELVAQLLDILPNICPIYAAEQLTKSATRSDPIQVVADKAFEEGYPIRQTEAEKKKDEEAKDDLGYLGKTYKAEKRRGNWYRLKCETALEEAFGTMPIGHIREVMMREASLFGPTYLHLLQDDTAQVKPFVPLKRPRPPTKGKGAAPPEWDEGAVEFELEKNWVLAHVASERIASEAKAAKDLADQIAIDSGEGVECGCCFGDFMADNMFQCCDGHLFCRECCTRHAETKLGDQSYAILCMDSSGCQAPFSEIELGRFLTTKSMELYFRLRLAQELEDAAIEGLEMCPSCPWAVVIDNPDEKLFRCQNESCGKVSCRTCRKSEHLPLSCEEYATELKKDKRHAVEDAMSEALIRKCPSCQKPYIKDTGCNKILCIKCKKYSCYICQKAISGYEHFDQGAGGARMPGSSTTGKCRLWDPKEAERDVQTVVAARDAAVKALRERALAEGVEVDEADLAVDAPAAPPLDAHVARYEARMAAYRVMHPPIYPPHMGPEEGQLHAFEMARIRQEARMMIGHRREPAAEFHRGRRHGAGPNHQPPPVRPDHAAIQAAMAAMPERQGRVEEWRERMLGEQRIAMVQPLEGPRMGRLDNEALVDLPLGVRRRGLDGAENQYMRVYRQQEQDQQIRERRRIGLRDAGVHDRAHVREREMMVEREMERIRGDQIRRAVVARQIGDMARRNNPDLRGPEVEQHLEERRAMQEAEDAEARQIEQRLEIQAAQDEAEDQGAEYAARHPSLEPSEAGEDIWGMALGNNVGEGQREAQIAGGGDLGARRAQAAEDDFEERDLLAAEDEMLEMAERQED